MQRIGAKGDRRFARDSPFRRSEKVMIALGERLLPTEANLALARASKAQKRQVTRLANHMAASTREECRRTLSAAAQPFLVRRRMDLKANSFATRVLAEKSQRAFHIGVLCER
jgi:hypothetical protein